MMFMMRLGVDARTMLGREQRGEGKCLSRLYRNINLIRPDWKIFYYAQEASGFSNSPEKPKGDARVFDLPGYRFNVWENIALPFNALKDGVEVLHCTASSTPWLAHCPIVLTVHDVIPLVCEDGWSSREIANFRRKLAHGLRASKAVIVPSANTKKDILRLFDISENKIQVIHWGRDALPKGSAIDAGAVENGLKRMGISGPYAAVFSSGAPRKNVPNILSSLVEIKKAGVDLTIVIVGVVSDSVRERYGKVINKLGLGKNVRMLGYVSEQDLEIIYAGCEFLLYVPAYEGFGMPILEAMARGIPVITSNTSSMPEIAGGAALLTDHADISAIAKAVLSLIRDPGQKARLVESGLKRSSQFSWQKAAESTIAVLEKSIQAT